MRYTLFFLYIISFLGMGCKEARPDLSPQLAEAQAQLSEQEVVIAELEKGYENQLVHTVYFKLKENISEEEKTAMLVEIEKLRNIEVVNNLEVGIFKELGDERALSEYEIMFQITLDNEEEYHIYQAHEIHQNLKKEAAKYLGAPPVTHDFMAR